MSSTSAYLDRTAPVDALLRSGDFLFGRSCQALVEPCGVGGRLGPPLHSQLGQEIGYVVLDGLLGQVQIAGDLTVGLPLGDEIEHLSLLSGQTGETGIHPWTGLESLQHPLRDRRI